MNIVIFSSYAQKPATDEVSPEPPPTATTAPTPTTPITEVGNARVVFVSNRSGDEKSRQLHLLDLETNEITLLDTGMDNLAYPTWSPDGLPIVFQSDHAG